MTTSNLLIADLGKWSPEYFFGSQVIERTPAGLSILYIVGIGVLIGFLILTFIDNFRRPKFTFERALPREVRRKLTQTLANRTLFLWQLFFLVAALSVFGFQVYWTYFADDSNEQFQALNYKDLRNRRATAASLKGWMLDRSGKLASSLAYYKVDKDGDIVRGYALEEEMAHLLGTERGTPGLERTLYRRKAEPMPEAWEVLTRIKRPQEEQQDVRVTIDRDLQAFIAGQLEGKKGAIVVINPQNGDVLAMYSNPSFGLGDAQDLEKYLKLEGNSRDKPLLNRATREFYVPGSIFKTFTLISAFRAGKQNSIYTSSEGGFRPTANSRPIVDSSQHLADDGTSVSGGCAGGCNQKDITQAYKVSSNQYFAQLTIDLGRERLKETASLMGIAAVDSPADALVQKFFPQVWNASNPAVANAIAPQQSAIVTGKDISPYDLGIEGIGQGYAGQMTPFQMALLAAAAGNIEGKLMKPRIEADQPPEAFSQLLSPQQAAAVREIMSTVTEEPGGTGVVISAKLANTGIRTGGKTGTAEKLAPEYDNAGKLKTETRRRKNSAGEWEEYKVPAMYKRIDSWFISIAPIERPQLAISVVVEGGGYGSKTAAPIAANVILKARDLGLMGDQYRPRALPPKREKVNR